MQSTSRYKTFAKRQTNTASMLVSVAGHTDWMDTPASRARTISERTTTFTTTTTVLTNPGIIDRLELDVNDYLHDWGFRIERLSHANAVFHTPCPLDNHVPPSLGTIHLRVSEEKLLPTVGPLLRTCVRLSHPDMSPMRLRAIVDCDFIIFDDEEVVVVSKGAKSRSRLRREVRTVDADDKNDDIKDRIEVETEDKYNENQSGDLSRSRTATAASRMAHHTHMLVRNSMGSALCLDLIVILPRYRVRIRIDKTKMDWQHQEEEKKDETKIMSLFSRSVELAMQRNPDTCYPSIRMVDCHRAGIENFDKTDATTLNLEVRTRMCTVQHSPLVFRWLHSLSLSPIDLRSSSASDGVIHISEPILFRASPIVVACIEKVANLHRVLMLCHNCDVILLSNIVVVLPNVADGRRNAEMRLREFEDAVDNFHKVVVVNSDRENVEGHRPTIVHEDRAFGVISDLMIERSHAMTTSAIVTCSRLQSMVGIDLHPSALTLDGDYMLTATSPALRKIRSADAIVFGYESTGIPDILTNSLNDWVQIPSRSSINVVAAMSIIFDALFA